MNPSEWFVHLVGDHFRPPATAVLSILPAGCALDVRPEPINEYDANALAVWLRTADIPPASHPQLRERLPGYGTSLDEVLSKDEIQLGYVSRTEAGEIAARLDGKSAPGRLSFSERGKPKILITITSDLAESGGGPSDDDEGARNPSGSYHDD